jgi:hypothetical protein
MSGKIILGIFAVVIAALAIAWWTWGHESLEEQQLYGLLKLVDREIVAESITDPAIAEDLCDSTLSTAESFGFDRDQLLDWLETESFRESEYRGRAIALLSHFDLPRAISAGQREADAEEKRAASQTTEPRRGWATVVAYLALQGAQDPPAALQRAQSFLSSPSASLRFAGHTMMSMLTFESRAPDPWSLGIVDLEGVAAETWPQDSREPWARDDFRPALARLLLADTNASPHPMLRDAGRRLLDTITDAAKRHDLKALETDVAAYTAALPPVDFKQIKAIWHPARLF